MNYILKITFWENADPAITKAIKALLTKDPKDRAVFVFNSFVKDGSWYLFLEATNDLHFEKFMQEVNNITEVDKSVIIHIFKLIK